MSNNEDDNPREDELRAFRERWKRDIQSRLPNDPPSSSSSSAKVKSSKGKIAIPNSRDLVSRAQASLSYPLNDEILESPPSTSPRFVNDSDVVLDPLVIAIHNMLLNPPPIEEGQERKTDVIEEENLFTFLDLPIEIQMYILSVCNTQTLERSSQSCRKLFLLARDNSLPQFRRLCASTWRDSYEEIPVYGKNWRRMFISRPRVRFDGIYISKNRYLHVGSTEGAFNQPVHQVTYYRFLRFMPDGSVISALSAEEPKQVLSWFKPLSSGAPLTTPANRQVLRGIYEIDEAQIVIYLAPFSPTANYFYCLKLMLSSTHPGKNARLNYISYEHYTGQPTWIFENPGRVSQFGESSPFNVDIKRYQFVKVPKRYWDEEGVDVSF
eukprot:TRINITY_DN4279_c0_g1_i4.p1 TRINITY_DN4279_c0_g1~~TRINITY_DN4279_c0_g1_i4.p1  ORF type:complete len:381 (+),score=52.04 TRINITY_DN4279_c0_g1_i4:204-1346(+)